MERVMIRLAVPLFLAVIVTGAATAQQRAPLSQQAKLERALKGLTPGTPQRCIRRDMVSELRGFEGEILYVAGRDKVWRNKTVGSCSGLARGDIIVTNSISRDYCAGDLVQTRMPQGGAFSGSCSLGEFIPYTK